MEDTVHVECLQASLHVMYNFLSIQCHKEYSEACSKLAKLQSSGAEAAKVLCDFEICCCLYNFDFHLTSNEIKKNDYKLFTSAILCFIFSSHGKVQRTRKEQVHN